MTKIVTQTYKYTHEYKVYINYVLLMLSMVMVMFYVFNIYKVIATSVAVSQAETRLSELENEVQSLDSKYIELSNRITPELVRARGMTEGTVTSYISRTTSLGVISLGGHEL